MKSLMKKLSLIVVAFCMIIGGNSIVFSDTYSDAGVSVEETAKVSPNSGSILSEQESLAIVSLASNCGVSYEELKSIFSFNVKNKRCSLVPVCDCKEHKDCFLSVFSYANPSYMKYYLSGNLMSAKYVEGWFYRSLRNINQVCPRSTTFLIKVEDQVVGRIGLGPLKDRRGVDTEIGYALKQEYSGQGIMSKAIDVILNFLKYLKSSGDGCYNFTRLRATAKNANIASNRILLSHGFVKSLRLINDGYGPENEYFYYF